MICEWCGKSFPNRKGRFCGGCMPPRLDGSDERDDGNLPEYLGPEDEELHF